MNKRYCYTGLNRPVLFLGVPQSLLFFEAIAIILMVLLLKLYCLIGIPCVIGFHLFIAWLYKNDQNWVDHLLFRLQIPNRRIYKKNVSYVPVRKKE